VLPSTSNRASGVVPVGVTVEREFVLDRCEELIGSGSREGFVEDGVACIWKARLVDVLDDEGQVAKLCASFPACRRIRIVVTRCVSILCQCFESKALALVEMTSAHFNIILEATLLLLFVNSCLSSTTTELQSHRSARICSQG
jgi:hypothetical protein